MADNNFLLPFLFFQQLTQTPAYTETLISQGVALASVCKNIENDEDDDSEQEGPGRGNSVEVSKALYAKRLCQNLYNDIRNLDPDVCLFESTIHLSREEFDGLHALVGDALAAPMDVRGEHVGEIRFSRRRRLETKEMLFLFLDVLGGGNEGGVGIERTGHRYGISSGTVSNYFRHILFALFKSLNLLEPQLIRRPNEEERNSMEGLTTGFPRCVFFLDGNNSRRWRPGRNAEQERAYDGYKKAHAWSLLVFCDLFGRFIRVEISEKGAESDRNMYISSEVYRNPDQFVSPGQHGMADMGFAGNRALVVPYKRNESTEWMFRGCYNRHIRRQRMVNEWGIGFINNRFRVFLGRWPFERELFPMAYNTDAMLSNWQFRRRGFALQPRSRYESKLAAHANRDSNSE